MPLELMVTPAAEADLSDIWNYTVTTWGRGQAVDYLSGLDATLDLLAEFPETAPLHREFAPPVRIRSYKAHLIIYQFDAASLTVIRVLNARSDWLAALAP